MTSRAASGIGGAFRRGYPRSFAVGAAFAVAWSPCIGPILGAVLTLAATSGTAWQGGLLLFAYSLGLGVWFLAFGVAVGWFAPRLRRIQPQLPLLMLVSGAVFIVVGALMFLGDFARLNQHFQSLGFLFGRTADAEQRLSSGTDGLLGPAVAFAGGMVSFLSPCVLPLVPVYLGNLLGEASVAAGIETAGRARVVSHAFAFVLGFSLVFSVVGASAGLAGSLLTDQLELLTRVGGLLLIALGLHMTGLVQVPYLDRTYQIPSTT